MVSGDPYGGAGNVDGTGNSARFSFPAGLVTDGSGNIYVADSNNNLIRKITSAGVVTTYAGIPGSAVTSGGSNDGARTAAKFLYPGGVARDAAGNIYIADTENFTIRKITAAGTVSTLAGAVGKAGSTDGTGSAALFNYPNSVAVDSTGNVFVADTNNQTIRKITSAGVVTTFAGSGDIASVDGQGNNASFDFPTSIAIDAADNIYVADSLSYAIRKITKTGFVSTLAGLAFNHGNVDGAGSAARFNDPENLTVDSAGNVYVAEFTIATIRKITSAGVVSTIAGASNEFGNTDGAALSARFNGPAGITADAMGNIYISDSYNNTIRKINSSMVVTTLAGKAPLPDVADGAAITAGFNYPGCMARDSAGNIFIADTYSSTIRKLSPAGVVTTIAGEALVAGSSNGIGTAAHFKYPKCLTVDNADYIYVADSGNSTIRKLAPDGTVTTFAGTANVIGNTDDFGVAARFNYPNGIVTDAARNVYVVDSYNHNVRKITPQGIVTTLAGSGTSGVVDGKGIAAQFAYPQGVTIDSAGVLYIADTLGNSIRKVSPLGVVTTLAGNSSTGGIGGYADGSGTAALFNYPVAMATDSAGNLYVADANNDVIRKVTPAGTVTTVVGTPGLAGFLPNASPAVISPAWGMLIVGNSLYFTDNNGIAMVANTP